MGCTCTLGSLGHNYSFEASLSYIIKPLEMKRGEGRGGKKRWRENGRWNNVFGKSWHYAIWCCHLFCPPVRAMPRQRVSTKAPDNLLG